MTAPLANLSYWNSGFVTPDQANSAAAQQFLGGLRQYDPNASFVSAGLDSIEGGGNNYAALNFDPSKLPAPVGGGQLARGPSAAPGQIGRTFAPSFSTVVNPSQVINPGAVLNSPIYGSIAQNTNFKPQQDGGLFGLADKILPYAVMSVLGYGAGAAGSSLLGGLGAGGAVGSSLGRTLGNFALGDFMSGGNSKFNPLSLLGTAGAALGLPSWVPSGVSTLAGLAQGGRPQFNPYALAMRYAPYFFGGGGG